MKGIHILAAVAMSTPPVAVAPFPVYAQDNSSVSRQCATSIVSTGEGEMAHLYVACGDSAAPLGPVDDHTLVELPSLDAAVVATTLYGTKRVWLVMAKDGERGLWVEELTGTIARLAGRGRNRGIADLDLEFTADGNQAPIAQLRSNSRGSGKAEKVRVDIAKLVRHSRELRARQRVTSND